MLGKFSELKISVLRLANEVKKTIRKVNALEKNRHSRPAPRPCIIFKAVWRKNERDMFVLMKMVKKNLEAKKVESNGTQS